MLTFTGTALAALVTIDAPLTYMAPESTAIAKDRSFNFTISVKQQNLGRLEALALAVSDPASPRYGKFLSQAEIDALTAPKAADVHAVTAWLSANGVDYTVSQQNAYVTTTVEVAERMLGTRLRSFGAAGKRSVLRAGKYSLPDQVHQAVAAIFGLHGAPLPNKPPLFSSETLVSGMPVAVTPSVLTSTYTVNMTVDRGSKNHQAVSEFQDQLMGKSDLKQFFQNFVPSALAGDERVYKFIGAPYKAGAGAEADLDVQYIMGVAPGVKTEFWEYTSMDDFCGDLHSYTAAILAAEDPAYVHSISYGWQGNLSDVGCKPADMAVVDSNWAKLAARGISVLISSGDAGSGIATDLACDPADPYSMSNDTALSGQVLTSAFGISPSSCCTSCHAFHPDAVGWTYTPPNAHELATGNALGKCIFYRNVSATRTEVGSTSGGPAVRPLPLKLYPSWPASSPWVTAVGATRFVGQQLGSEEMASDQFGSGGGFSFDFDRSNAKWQEEHVSQYMQLQRTLPKFPPPGSFNSLGRATPDLAALGEGYQVYISSGVKSIGGTSASTPVIAGFVSLLNEARIRAGQPQMGFLNPFLYQNPSAFFDVIKGTNAITRTGGEYEYGYAAARGWDPATGLGTPHFDKLLAAAMALVQ